MKTAFNLIALSAIALILSGCAGAAFNRIDFTLNHNISIGQELIDLKTAHEEGIINDSEYAEAKKNMLSVLNHLGEFEEK